MTKLFLALSLLVFTTATAQAQAPFFQGKTITIVVGTKAGDAYDLYPRMLAELCRNIFPEAQISLSKTFRERRR